MRNLVGLGLSACLLTSLAACGSTPEGEVKDISERKTEIRMELIDMFEECLDDAGGDKTVEAACNGYMKASEALK